MSTTPPPPAWLRSSTAPPLSQQQQQQQALPQLVAHDSAWPTMAQQQRRQQPQPRGTAALDGRDNNEVTAASPTSVWSGTVSRSYESMRQLPPPPHQQHMQQQHTSPPPPPSHTNSPPARSVGGRSSRAAVTVSGHGRRVLRATPAPVLISSEEAVATRTTGGRWAAQRQQHTPPPQQQQQRRRYSTASSRHSSNASRQSRATTPPPPLQSLSAQPYARRPSSAAHTAAAATAYNNNSSNNARRGGVAAAASWAGDAPRARLHYEQQQQQQAAYTHTMTPYSSRTARSAATMAYTPLTRQNLRAWEQGQLHVAEPPGSAAAAASPPLLFATEHARSPSPSQASQHAAAAASVRSGGGGSSHSSRRSSRRRGRNGDGAERATTAAPGSAASTALAPPSPAQQQQSTLPWWAQTELLHRGLTRPTSVTQASTLAATSNRTATTAPRAVTAAAGQQQQPQPPLQLVSNDSIFAGKHRTVTRSNPLNIWNHESHILRNWLTHNNNNNTPPPMLFASAQSGGPATTAGTAAGAAGAPPRLVASEATTAVHTTRNNTMAPTAAAAVLTPSGSSRSTTTTTTTTLAAVDDKQPPAGGNGDDGGGGGGGGGQGQQPPPPDDEQPQPPPPSAMRVRGRTFRTRNLNALHAFAWDRRIYLPAQDGLLAQPFRLFASPRFWEKIDWAVRGSLLCIVPMLILCLEPRTGGIFPLRSSAVALAFWINMPTLGGGLRELYIVLKGFSWSLVLLCIIIAWNPRATWLVLLLLFLAVFVTSFAVEQARRISTYTLVLLIMQYIYSREKTTYRFVVDYFVTLLLALAFGMVSFVVPYIRWASDIAHHYLGVLGDAVSLSVRGACAGFWVSNRLERQLHVTRLRQLRATITPCLARIATGMSEMGYEPHTGVYTAQMRTRLAFLRHISIVLESMTQVVEQIADDPALADTPLCNAFGERLSGEVLRIGAVMDATILRITDLTSLVTVQDMDDFGRAVARYQDALAAAREELILNNPDYHADHSDILLGFFFFCIEELCESIAAFHEAEVPPNNFVYFLTFPLRDINSLVVACITLRNAVWRRRTITRRLKEAIKLALCIVIAAIFQVYALGNNASPVAGVDIIALVYNRTGGMSFQYASNRLLGTVLGSLTGFLSVQIANGRRWVLYIFVALISFVGAYVQAAPGYYALGNAICNSVISIVTQYRDQGAALVRIQQNCFAILIYFIVSSLVWPMRGNTKVKMGLDISLRMFRETTYRLLRNLDMPEDASEVDRDAGELIAEMNKRIVVQVTNLPGALVEPTMDSAEFPEMSWRMLIASQQKLLATLMMMRSAYRTFMSSKIGSGADRTNLSVHWVVLHRISPYMTELSNLLFAAVEIYLWSLSKATIVPTAHLTTIHEGMLHCRRRIFRVYLETIQREVDGSVSDAVPGGGGDVGDGYNKDASGSDVMHNWWEKARSAGAAAAAASLSSSAASVPHASPATSNNNNNDRVTATGVVVDNGSMRRTNAAAVTTTGSAAAAAADNNNNAATTTHNASFDGGAGTLRAQRKTRQGAFLGYRLRPEEQQALRSYIETGTLLGTVAGISQSALNNASFVLEAPDYAANATAARGGAAVHNGSLATAAAHATTSANEPVANASGAAAALSPSSSHALGAARTPAAPTLSNASFLPPHPPRHGLGSSNNNHTLASAALPSMTASHAATGAAATAPDVATAAQQQQQLQQNMTFVGGGGSGLGNASMLGTRLSNHSMLLAGVHAARRVDPVMGGGDLFTAARPNRAKQLAADAAAAAAAASSSGSPAAAGGGGGVAAAAGSAAQPSAAAAAAATESTSAVAAAGAAADTALAIATDAAAAAAASSHAQKSNDNSNNNNNVTSAAAATTAAAAAPGTPAPGVAAATSSNAHAPHTPAVSNATFAGLAATGGGGGAAPATPASAAAAVVAPIAAGSSGGLLNSSLALHNRVAQGNVDMLAATHHDAPHLPPLSPSASALPNHTFVGNNNNDTAAAAAAAAPPAATHGMMAIAVEHQSTSPPPPELHAAERASSADNAAAAAAAAAATTSPHTDKTAAMAGHEPSVFAVPSRPPSRAPSRLPSRRPSALQRPGTMTSPPLPPSSASAAAAGASPHMSGSFAPVVSNRSVAAGSLLGRSHHGGGAAAGGVGNNSISGGGGGGALSGLLSSIKRMGNKPGTSRFALRDYEEDAEVDRDTYAIDHMEGGGGEHAGLRGTLSQQHGVTQSSPQLAAEAGHTSPAAAAGGVSNSSGLRRSFASALATLRRRGKGGSHDNEPAGEGGGGRAAGRRGSNSSAGGGSDSVDGGRPLPLSRATAPRRTRDEVDDEDDAMTPEERDAVAAAGGGDGSGGYGDAMAAAARARDADEVLDEASNYDAEQGVFILTNRDVHSLEAFLFGIRTLIAQVEEFEQYMLQMIHSNEMAKKL